MTNIRTVEVLKKKGYAMAEIKVALDKAETSGKSFLDGWCIRYKDNGEMIVLHPSNNGIYIGDYTAHLHFEKTLRYSYNDYGFYGAKHSELERILSLLNEHKTNGYILCECSACDYKRRKEQVEKLGYTVYESNFAQCENDLSNCKFLVA